MLSLRSRIFVSYGSSTFVPWIDESLSIPSHGRFPRVMVTSSRDPAFLAVAEIPRPQARIPHRQLIVVSRGASTNSLVTFSAGTFVSLRMKISRVTWAFKLGEMYHELVLRRLCMMKMFLGVGSGVARMILTTDDVLVSVVTGQIVSRACCHGSVLAILN